jgi:hypothetical protein
MGRLACALAISSLLAGSALAAVSPFERLSGSWSGTGTIETSDGNREPLRCRAGYDVLDGGTNLRLNLRCASQSYNFDLSSSAEYAGGKITGVWNESTLNTGGRLSGTARGDQIQIVANSPSFSAMLTLVTQGNKQNVTIQSQQPDAKIKGASISLSRG